MGAAEQLQPSTFIKTVIQRCEIILRSIAVVQSINLYSIHARGVFLVLGKIKTQTPLPELLVCQILQVSALQPNFPKNFASPKAARGVILSTPTDRQLASFTV
jgi:hypothetical protein